MALQDVLAGFSNPAASRAAILQKLNIDPQRAAGYGGNTQFDNALSQLYTQGLQTSANLDTQEGDLNRGYEKNVAQSAIDRDRALQTIKGNFAQRGMTFSGAQVDELGRANSDFDRYLANLGSEKEAGLGSIGRNRLNLEQGLSTGRMAAEEGYGSDLSAYLQQQAIDLWNSVMQQNQQNALMQAMNRPQQVVQQVSQRAAPSPRPAPRPAAPAPAPAPYRAPVNTQGFIQADIPRRPAPAPAKKPLTPLRGIY